MHELALMQSLVEAVSEQTVDSKVLVVRLEVGAQAGVAPHALEFCFDVCCEGTPLQGARLEILQTSGQTLRIREVEVT